MMKNILTQKIRKGLPVYGGFVSELVTPEMATLLEAAGYDFVIFDGEHGVYDLQKIREVLPGFRGETCTPLVRIPLNRVDLMQQTLDLGAGGIMVPGVESPEDIVAAVSAVRFPPQGTRGLSLSRPHTCFKSVPRDTFLLEANANTLLIIQVESRKALSCLDALLEVPGFDMVFIGCADLSLSLNIENSFSGPLLETVRETVMKIHQKGVPVGINAHDPAIVHELQTRGVSFFSLSTDTRAFLNGLRLPLAALDVAR